MLYNINIKAKIESDLPPKQLENQFVLAWRNPKVDSDSSVIDDEIVDIHALCPHCEVELASRMFDIDMTNLEEHDICEKCGYGQPALR